jgi:phage recombination protein Bet
VDPFLLRLEKGSRVIATIDDDGWIAKIIKAAVTSDAPTDVPITVATPPKPEKPACYKAAICPQKCDGDPGTCSVKKSAKKTSKKSEAPIADKLEKAGFAPDAKPGVTETMTDAEVQDMKTRADAAVAEKARIAEAERTAKEAEWKAAKEKLAHDEELLKAAQKNVQVKPEPLPEGWTYPAPEGGIEGIVAATKANAERLHPEPVTVKGDLVPTVQYPSQKYTDEDMLLLRHVVAKGCSEPEFRQMMYVAVAYGLNPLLKQIWIIKRNERDPAIIIVGRDGMLTIAHRSGQFDGIRSWVEYAPEDTARKKPIVGHCEIWRKDMTHSFKTEVLFSEYEQPIPKNGYLGLWQTKPSVMLIKVAESVCLRKAFSVSGVYDPDEIQERA